jgi:hypothetical protein
MRLDIGFSCDRDNYASNWSEETIKEVFEKLYNNPFYTEWKEMSIGSHIRVPLDIKKALKSILSSKQDQVVGIYGGNNGFVLSRNRQNYNADLRLDESVIKNDVVKFRYYVIEIGLNAPKFRRLIGMLDSSMSAETQKKFNIDREKSMFSYMAWLNVVSPLGYNDYYKKEDLLKAPYYKVEEIKPDIVLIQAYKDPFDLENEESLNYLRNGVEYLNKNIIFLKDKE